MPASRDVLLCSLLITAAHALSTSEIDDKVTGLRVARNILARDEDHHHHGTPLLVLNETAVLMGHDPTPPSYWTIDVVEGSGHALPAGEY
ncbi:hypothetical protein HWV62_18384 [Athelia sp. TMB]|nr:hypothetical protein HWV62_2751 [Athelia sp. TMB]KAF7983959.1 hypothetical protein HWV62_18384 [Athelia sp. TMB]